MKSLVLHGQEHHRADPGPTRMCGMRFYNGINEKGQKTLVYVGIDADGKDIVKRIVVQDDGVLVTSNGSCRRQDWQRLQTLLADGLLGRLNYNLLGL